MAEGVVRTDPRGEVALDAPPDAVDAAITRIADEEEAHRTLERTRVDLVRRYAESRQCRREQLLGYLGEAYEPPCDACDRCRSSDGPPTVDTDEADDLGPGTPVVHPQWGDGEVVSLEPPDAVVVVFETAGYRTLSLPLVRERELLHPRRSARGAADRPG
jgi:ATP-dependent DNA helicase RecQ